MLKTENPQAITAWGFNLTHWGQWDQPNSWMPTVNVDGKVHVERLNAAGTARTLEPLVERIHRLIENTSRLNRVWVLHADGTRTCLYWYERGLSDLHLLETAHV